MSNAPRPKIESGCWPTARLEDVCALITDGTHQTPTYAEEGVVFLSSKNVVSGKIDWENVKRIPEWLHTELHGRLSPRKGDLLLAKNGTTGVAAVVDRDDVFDIYVSLALLRPKPNVLPEYLHRALNSPIAKKQFNGSLKGIGVPNLHLKDIRRAIIPLPPLAEQRRIAEVLDRAEALRAKRRAALAQLDSLTQSLFLDLFGDPLAKNGHGEHVPFESVTRRITYGFTCPMKHLDSGIPIITAKNVRDGFIDLEKVHYADKSEFDALTAKSKPVRGDVLITKDGTIGRCAVVENDEPLCINQSVALVQPDHAKVLPTYLVAYLSSDRVQHVMKSMGKGNALAHLQISEATLHLLELLGGWPGAWIAQRRLRHKCSKVSYQIVFWLIVLAWQFAAFDSLRAWKSSRAGLKWIEPISEHRK